MKIISEIILQRFKKTFDRFIIRVTDKQLTDFTVYAYTRIDNKVYQIYFGIREYTEKLKKEQGFLQ